jgi:hypothetical protein
MPHLHLLFSFSFFLPHPSPWLLPPIFNTHHSPSPNHVPFTFYNLLHIFPCHPTPSCPPLLVSPISLSSPPSPYTSHSYTHSLSNHLLSQPFDGFSLFSFIPTTPPPLPIDQFLLLTSLAHHIPPSPLAPYYSPPFHISIPSPLSPPYFTLSNLHIFSHYLPFPLSSCLFMHAYPNITYLHIFSSSHSPPLLLPLHPSSLSPLAPHSLLQSHHCTFPSHPPLTCSHLLPIFLSYPTP